MIASKVRTKQSAQVRKRTTKWIVGEAQEVAVAPEVGAGPRVIHIEEEVEERMIMLISLSKWLYILIAL